MECESERCALWHEFAVRARVSKTQPYLEGNLGRLTMLAVFQECAWATTRAEKDTKGLCAVGRPASAINPVKGFGAQS